MTGKITGHGKTRKYFLDGREVPEAEFRSAFPARDGIPGAAGPSAWRNFTSEALSCHPDQVEAMNERNRRAGLGARYLADGTCAIPDRNERRKLLRHEGVFDRDGGYGD